MLDSKIIQEVERLSVKERLVLMEYLARSVQNDLQTEPDGKNKAQVESKLSTEIEFSRGMLRRAGVPPFTDEEVKQIVADSLLQDYLSLK